MTSNPSGASNENEWPIHNDWKLEKIPIYSWVFRILRAKVEDEECEAYDSPLFGFRDDRGVGNQLAGDEITEDFNENASKCMYSTTSY